jgi:hypothetical protein
MTRSPRNSGSSTDPIPAGDLPNVSTDKLPQKLGITIQVWAILVAASTIIGVVFVAGYNYRRLTYLLETMQAESASLKKQVSDLQSETKRLTHQLETRQAILIGPQSPMVSLIDDLQDEKNEIIDKTKAPFRVRARGTASDSRGLYVYLIVNDFNAEWIQPTAGLGANVDKDFLGHFYLGIKDDPRARDKLYKVFSVVTDRPYKEFDRLDRTTVKAESESFELFRTR